MDATNSIQLFFLNFCITAIGLEQQLQEIVISKEQRTLEETLKQILR